jgi:hypothetical protein
MKPHTIDYYKDGQMSIPFCKICSAEGLKLFEDCPQKVGSLEQKSLDEKKQTAK